MAGGRTIVDLTAVGLSPDPRQLRTIAESLDVNVIAGTGYYISQSLPQWVATSSVTQLADNLISDITTGGEAGVLRGAIGEIALESGDDIEFAYIATSARAQSETHAPVFMHVMSGILPDYRELTDQALTLFAREGGDVRHLVLCHQDGPGIDVEYQVSLLEKGIILAYDTFGSEGVFAFGKEYVQLPTDTQGFKNFLCCVTGAMQASFSSPRTSATRVRNVPGVVGVSPTFSRVCTRVSSLTASLSKICTN